MKIDRGVLRSGVMRGAAAILVTALLVIVLPTAGRTDAVTAVILGYDSFIDRFTILEDDTAETVHDFYAGLKNSIAYRSGTVKAGLFNVLRFGNQTIDENLDAELSVSPGRKTRVDLRTNAHWKQFRPGSDYTFGNDYIQSNTSLKVKRAIGRESSLNLRHRFELVDYAERTDFDYDYRYIEGGLECELGSYFSRFMRCCVSIGLKEAPDTTDLGYRRTMAEAELQLHSGSWAGFHLLAAGDRRDYRGTARSPYWNVLAYADLSLGRMSGTTVSLRCDAELTFYDEPTSTYFDSQFLRGGIRIKVPISAASIAFIEPRIARMLCRDFPEERYWEVSAVFGAELLKNDTFWAMCSYEPGLRDYIAATNELYSDFTLHRISVMGSLSLPASATLNVYVSHDPEHHERRDDDFSITLVSVDLTRRF